MSRRAASILVLAVALAVLLTTTAAWAKATPLKQAPVNLTAPSVDGQAVVGSALTANAGTWDGKALKYVYQWYGCDSGGGSCSALGSATSSSYTAASADAGRTLRVSVTASNQTGSTTATSGASAVIAAPAAAPSASAPSATSSPSVSGTTQEGQTLTASAGSWNGTAPIAYAYQWQRCDFSGAGCAAVAGATAATYALGSGDVGSTLRVSLTASNPAGSATASSTATAVVAALVTTANSYYSEHFDGAYTNPFWNPDPVAAMSWTSGFAGQGLRLTACASSDAAHLCQNSTSSYGQVIENRVWGTYAHAGWLPGSSTNLSYGNGQSEDSWYRFKLYFPSDYQPTPGSQNTVFAFHVDGKTEANASSVGSHAYSTLIGVASDPPIGYTIDSACPGTPHFCTKAGVNPRLYLQMAGGVIPAQSGGVSRFNMPSGSLKLDHWYDVVLHVYWSPDPAVGHVQWWLDGAKVLDSYRATEYTRTDGTLSYGSNMGFFNYRYWASWAAGITGDELVWGPTAASIGLAATSTAS